MLWSTIECFNLVKTLFHTDLTTTMFTLLERMESLETENSLLREEVDVLRTTATEQEQIIADLQLADNSTDDRLQAVETDLQTVEIDLQGTTDSLRLA